MRAEFGLEDEDQLLLFIGSGFRTKGLARALHGVAALPATLRAHTRLLAVGQDRADAFIALARRLGIADRVTIVTGRDDVPRLMLGADLLLHAAHAENTGAVLLEAMVAGLPVLTTDVCGFAHFVIDADAGVVLPSPFMQSAFDSTLQEMLASPRRAQWRANGIAFAAHDEIYAMNDRAADIILATAVARRANAV